jgi:polyhydroxybutyrate depolymerase
MRRACSTVLGAILVACGGAEAPGGAVGGPEGAPGGPAPVGPGVGDGGAVERATAEAGAPDPRCAGKGGPAGRFERTLTSRGRERSYVLHVPGAYDTTRPAPLVLVFHGYTRDPADAAEISHLDRIAEQRGFLVAFPAGIGGSFNAGACCGAARFTGIDDAGFAADLVDALAAERCVDPKRVYAAGFSNGGFLAHRLACEASGRFAAIASVSGVLGVGTCSPVRPVPVLQIHGTADPVVPYGGNPVLGYPSVAATMTGWAARDGCATTAVERSRQGAARCERWPGCSAGADVDLCTIDGGGHDWPGGGSAWGDGGPPAGFVATTEIVDFFEKHPMP